MYAGYTPLINFARSNGGLHSNSAANGAITDVLVHFADVNYAVYRNDDAACYDKLLCYWAQVVASGDLERARVCLERGGADPNWPHVKLQGSAATSVPFRPYITVLLIAICREVRTRHLGCM